MIHCSDAAIARRSKAPNQPDDELASIRVAAGQIVLSVALLVLTTLAVIHASVKISRLGVLIYGKRPSVVEAVRWPRYI
jgi:hypothetical protein